MRDGEWRAWLAAAVATFAVSTIHPLIAAMLALALGLICRPASADEPAPTYGWIRSAAVAGLIVIVMFLPLVQLVLSRGESPLGIVLSATLEGWDVGEKQVPALPFLHVPSLDYYGPLPEMERPDGGRCLRQRQPVS